MNSFGIITIIIIFIILLTVILYYYILSRVNDSYNKTHHRYTGILLRKRKNKGCLYIYRHEYHRIQKNGTKYNIFPFIVPEFNLLCSLNNNNPNDDVVLMSKHIVLFAYLIKPKVILVSTGVEGKKKHTDTVKDVLKYLAAGKNVWIALAPYHCGLYPHPYYKTKRISTGAAAILKTVQKNNIDIDCLLYNVRMKDERKTDKRNERGMFENNIKRSYPFNWDIKSSRYKYNNSKNIKDNMKDIIAFLYA